MLLAGISPAGAGDKLMNAKLYWKVNTRAAASRNFNWISEAHPHMALSLFNKNKKKHWLANIAGRTNEVFD